MRVLAVAALLLVASCGQPAADVPAGAVAGKRVAMAHARTFKVVERDGYRIVDLSAPIISWGASAEGPEQKARLVLVPRGVEPPALTGDLTSAAIIRTPVRRIATNHAPFEAMAVALGVADRLVAVGGVKSWDDGIRAKVRAGKIGQTGYGWHSPPELDALAAARPDVMLMSLGDLGHAQHMARIRALNIPIVPAFMDAEPSYMGPVDYIRLFGMLTGKEREADAYVGRVERNVAALKASVAGRPKKSVILAWFMGGDVWMAAVRNSWAHLLRDAGGINPLEKPDDNRQDAYTKIGTETLIRQGRDAECWIDRDTHSVPFRDASSRQQFRAVRENCLYAIDGMTKPAADAFDLYETAVIRPDLLLADMVTMLHPEVRQAPGRYIRKEAGQ